MIDQAKVTGAFEVKTLPQPSDHASGDAVNRLLITKTFHGPLDAISEGQMLAVRTPVEGSMAYVALERVTGTLEGRSGSFMLQHTGTMVKGAMSLLITVVVDSGTGELSGLAGSMGITINQGDHSYSFSYTLPPRTAS